jgi:hypothetical protein
MSLLRSNPLRVLIAGASCIALLIPVCSAQNQRELTYDGFEEITFSLYFSYEKTTDTVSVSGRDDRGEHISEIVRPNTEFLGEPLTVTPYRDWHIFRLGNHEHPGYGWMDDYARCGYFTLPGHETVKGYQGGILEIGNFKAKINNLDKDGASLSVPGVSEPILLKISSAGRLRTEHSEMRRDIWQIKEEHWRYDAFHRDGWVAFAAIILLCINILCVFGFALLGLSTLEPFSPLRRRVHFYAAPHSVKSKRRQESP